MPDNLPIYGDNPSLRSSAQFTDLLPLKHVDTTAIWKKSDEFIARMEGAGSIAEGRGALRKPDKHGLLRAHSTMFGGRAGAGELRKSTIAGPYRGQDCPEPEFIERSLDNFFSWMEAESIAELHPIERAAVALTRIVDIWPFDFGNLTMAIVLSNSFLHQAGFPPFFVLPEHRAEFGKVVAQAITIDTQPLVNAIHRTLKREMQAVV